MNISIIITTFNASRFIVKTLDSIKRQIFQDFEVVIIDDGSTDDTVKTINDYLSVNTIANVSIIQLPHIGRAKALNYGVKSAQYDWVAILDADDLWHINKLAIQVACVEKYNLEFLTTKSSLFHGDDEIDIASDLKIDSLNDNPVTETRLNKMLCRNRVMHSSVLIKKRLVHYDETRTSQLDYDLWLRLIKQGVKIYQVDLVLSYHRIHKGQQFEARKPFIYAMKSTLLQLKYCLYFVKPWQGCYVIMKIFYYLLFSRKFRLKFANR